MTSSSLSPSPREIVIIAAFNEATKIGSVVSELKARGYEVVVVDDGSADRTREAALEAGASVVTHPVNLGQGAALQTGMHFGVRGGYDRFVTFDADGQHDPEDIARMRAMMAETGADFVLGSRFLGTTIGMPAARKALLKLAVVFTRVTSGLRLTDAHNGLRYFSRAAAKTIRLHQNRMAHASEILDQIGAISRSTVSLDTELRSHNLNRSVWNDEQIRGVGGTRSLVCEGQA